MSLGQKTWGLDLYQEFSPEFRARWVEPKFLGQGAYGVVLEVRDAQLDRRAALKILDPARALSPEDQDHVEKRFLREAQLLGKLDHPGTTQLYDYGVQAGRPFLLMEFLEGQDLEELMRAHPSGLEPARVRAFVDQLLPALARMQELGILHRDFKPANLMVHGDRIWITDFGLGKPKNSHTLTRTGSVVGTPVYLPPELLEGADWSPQGDLFSLGLVLIEALSGLRARSGHNLSEAFRDEQAGEAHWRQFLPEDTPSDLAQLVLWFLEEDPKDRPQDLSRLARTWAEAPESIQTERVGRTRKLAPLPLPDSELVGNRDTRLSKNLRFLPAAILVGVLLGYGVPLRSPDPGPEALPKARSSKTSTQDLGELRERLLRRIEGILREPQIRTVLHFPPLTEAVAAGKAWERAQVEFRRRIPRVAALVEELGAEEARRFCPEKLLELHRAALLLERSADPVATSLWTEEVHWDLFAVVEPLLSWRSFKGFEAWEGADPGPRQDALARLRARGFAIQVLRSRFDPTLENLYLRRVGIDGTPHVREVAEGRNQIYADWVLADSIESVEGLPTYLEFSLKDLGSPEVVLAIEILEAVRSSVFELCWVAADGTETLLGVVPLLQGTRSKVRGTFSAHLCARFRPKDRGFSLPGRVRFRDLGIQAVGAARPAHRFGDVWQVSGFPRRVRFLDFFPKDEGMRIDKRTPRRSGAKAPSSDPDP